MIRMVTTRLASSSLSIVILVTLVFFMVHLTPGGPAYSILGQKATAASVAEVNARLGLNVPIWSQYGLWWWHLAHGQLGYSYLLSRPVGSLLWQYEINTLVFYSLSIVISTLLSIALGLIQGCLLRALAGAHHRRPAARLLCAAAVFRRRHAGALVCRWAEDPAGQWHCRSA